MYSVRVGGVPDAHRQRPLACSRVGWPVAQVVDHEQRTSQTSGAGAHHCAQPGQTLDQHVRRTDRRDQPEEDEDEELAEPGVAVRTRPARVAPGCQDARHADGEEPPRGRRGEDESSDGGDTEGDEGGTLDRTWWGQPGRNESHRSDPGVVGATDAVAVVIGVVHADLEGEAHDEGQRQPPPRATSPAPAADPAPSATGTIAAGSVRSRAPRTNARVVLIGGRCTWATPADDRARRRRSPPVRSLASAA